MKGFNSELMARRGYSLGARLLAAAFWPQSVGPSRTREAADPSTTNSDRLSSRCGLRIAKPPPQGKLNPSSPRTSIVRIDLSARCRLACPFAL